MVPTGLGLKGVKIARNVMKVGVHCYLPNAKINLRSNFNFEKLVKIETLLYGFATKSVDKSSIKF